MSDPIISLSRRLHLAAETSAAYLAPGGGESGEEVSSAAARWQIVGHLFARVN